MGETRYSWDRAHAVAADIVDALRPACERIEIAGSLRRHKPDVGDVEILYIPVMQEEPDPLDMFATRIVSLADGRIEVGEACIGRGRTFIGIEMDTVHFDGACRRIEREHKQGKLTFSSAAG